MPISINGADEVQGAILYDENYKRVLEFFTSTLSTSSDAKRLEYPQRPDWIVEYPLLGYKHVSPTNREICIVNLAKNTPQKVIDLVEWEFEKFVRHT